MAILESSHLPMTICLVYIFQYQLDSSILLVYRIFMFFTQKYNLRKSHAYCMRMTADTARINYDDSIYTEARVSRNARVSS